MDLRTLLREAFAAEALEYFPGTALSMARPKDGNVSALYMREECLRSCPSPSCAAAG